MAEFVHKIIDGIDVIKGPVPITLEEIDVNPQLKRTPETFGDKLYFASILFLIGLALLEFGFLGYLVLA